jgi:hypothetical protein
MCSELLKKIRNDLILGTDGNGTGGSGVGDMQYVLDTSHAEYIDVKSVGRHVRTRLYFTSESHLHTLLNVLRFGHHYFGTDAKKSQQEHTKKQASAAVAAAAATTAAEASSAEASAGSVPPGGVNVGAAGGSGDFEENEEEDGSDSDFDKDGFVGPVLDEEGEAAISDENELCYLTHLVFRVFERRGTAPDDPARFRAELSFSPGANRDPSSFPPRLAPVTSDENLNGGGDSGSSLDEGSQSAPTTMAATKHESSPSPMSPLSPSVVEPSPVTVAVEQQQQQQHSPPTLIRTSSNPSSSSLSSSCLTPSRRPTTPSKPASPTGSVDGGIDSWVERERALAGDPDMKAEQSAADYFENNPDACPSNLDIELLRVADAVPLNRSLPLTAVDLERFLEAAIDAAHTMPLSSSLYPSSSLSLAASSPSASNSASNLATAAAAITAAMDAAGAATSNSGVSATLADQAQGNPGSGPASMPISSSTTNSDGGDDKSSGWGSWITPLLPETTAGRVAALGAGASAMFVLARFLHPKAR